MYDKIVVPLRSCAVVPHSGFGFQGVVEPLPGETRCRLIYRPRGNPAAESVIASITRLTSIQSHFYTVALLKLIIQSDFGKVDTDLPGRFPPRVSSRLTYSDHVALPFTNQKQSLVALPQVWPAPQFTETRQKCHQNDGGSVVTKSKHDGSPSQNVSR